MTPYSPLQHRGLRILLAVNVAASGAAAVVLTVSPSATPHLVGIPFRPEQDFVAYLLAAAKLAFAALSLSALIANSRHMVAQALMVLIVFHAASGLAGVLAVAKGTKAFVLLNVLLRFAMSSALFYCFRQLHRD